MSSTSTTDSIGAPPCCLIHNELRTSGASSQLGIRAVAPRSVLLRKKGRSPGELLRGDEVISTTPLVPAASGWVETWRLSMNYAIGAATQYVPRAKRPDDGNR